MGRAHPTAVLKFGGEVVADTMRLVVAMQEVGQLTDRGWRFVLCHGGNPQANALTARLGLEKKQVGGRRITDAPTLQLMKHVLAGECNVDVVAAAVGQGLRAVGISGVSAGLVTARRRPPKVMSGCGPEPIDFGFVGDVTNIDTSLIEHLWDGGYTPVLNTLGISEGPNESGVCEVYNINADTVSSAVAASLRVDHLFLMTGVPGVLRDKDDMSTRIPRLTETEARQAIAGGVIVGGMIPKVEEALSNLAAGIGAVHVVGADAGAIVGEAAEPGSVGTVLLLDNEA
ncbi:MAG: acetylglutamate kinase [Leptolyngbya sp. PLA3]|nr:MAG: acetylglutamate kinase [Cyanobacteria bacterium CYA]MCE7969338.1 acetylglutamate kinase [Leptolyngbya sp. PL-A3]